MRCRISLGEVTGVANSIIFIRKAKIIQHILRTKKEKTITEKESAEETSTLYISAKNTHHDSLNVLYVQFCKEKEKIALKCINMSSYNSALNAYGTFCNLNEHSMTARKTNPVP
jgi:hypothetical protein